MVQSGDQSGDIATSTDYTFTTLGSGKSVPALVISAVHATNISTSTASIVWTTNVPASSLVKYGTSTAYGRIAPPGIGSSIGNTGILVTNHSVSLIGLAPSTTYHCLVQSSDAAGHAATSTDVTFTTSSLGKGILPPIVSPVHVIDVSTSTNYTFTTTITTSAPTSYPIISAVSSSRPKANASITASWTTEIISWITDQPADSQVVYGTSPSALSSSSALNPALTTSHSVSLVGLFPGAQYYYRVQSKNAGGLLSTSSTFSFTTY
jgi:hypothetical protein